MNGTFTCTISLSSQLMAAQRKLVESKAGRLDAERDFDSRLQELRSSERKLQEELRMTSARLQGGAETSAQAQLQLGEAQGRLSATEAELMRSEAARRDLDFRLASLQSALTRTLGIGGHGLRGRSPAVSTHSSLVSVAAARRRSVSPLRCSLSPPKGE